MRDSSTLGLNNKSSATSFLSGNHQAFQSSYIIDHPFLKKKKHFKLFLRYLFGIESFFLHLYVLFFLQSLPQDVLSSFNTQFSITKMYVSQEEKRKTERKFVLN